MSHAQTLAGVPKRESPRRWVVLGAFAAVAGTSQMLWLNFAPILTQVQTRYVVGELGASALVLVFPLLYVLLSLPAGRLVDTRGYRRVVGLGAVTMAVFSAVRIWDTTFWTLLAGQVGIAIAQPFVVNGISKLVADWFGPGESAIATGIGTMGMFLGMAAGLSLTPVLVRGLELHGAMIVFFGVSAAAALAFFLLVPPESATPASAAPVTAGTEIKSLLADRRLLLLFAMSLLGLGAFNGLTTWLEEILAPQGFVSEQAGLVGGVLIVGGIAGAVVIPLLSDRVRRRKPFLVLCTAVATALVFPLCTIDRFGVVVALAALLGFFFLPAFALLLDMSAQLAGEERAGAATGILMLVGNAGGVLVPIAMQALKGHAPTFRAGVLLLVALLGVAFLLTFRAVETAGPPAPLKA